MNKDKTEQQYWLSVTISHYQWFNRQKLSKRHLEAVSKLGEMLESLTPESSYQEIYNIIQWIDLDFPIERFGMAKREILKYISQCLYRMLKNIESREYHV